MRQVPRSVRADIKEKGTSQSSRAPSTPLGEGIRARRDSLKLGLGAIRATGSAFGGRGSRRIIDQVLARPPLASRFARRVSTWRALPEACFCLFRRGVAIRRRAARERPSRGPRRGSPRGPRRLSSRITSQTCGAPPFAVRRDLHVKVRRLWRSVAPVRARCSSARRSRDCVRVLALSCLMPSWRCSVHLSFAKHAAKVRGASARESP